MSCCYFSVPIKASKIHCVCVCVCVDRRKFANAWINEAGLLYKRATVNMVRLCCALLWAL